LYADTEVEAGVEEVGMIGEQRRLEILSAANGLFLDAEPHYLPTRYILIYCNTLNAVQVLKIQVLISNLFPIYF